MVAGGAGSDASRTESRVTTASGGAEIADRVHRVELGPKGDQSKLEQYPVRGGGGSSSGGGASAVVVGVDGSDASARALRWAVEEARLHGARVVAVHAWLYPHVGIGHSGVPLGYEELRRDAEYLLQAMVRAVAETASGVAIEPRLVEGIPADELIAAADDAEMLVLGSRGLGGFAGLLLGSVGQQCVRHARCPVVIVPHEKREPAGGRA